MSEITIKVNGRCFLEWNELVIQKDLEAMAGCFEFNIVQTSESWPIVAGDKIEIYHANTPLIYGFVDYLSPSLSADDRTIQVAGRDNTCDIIDCSHTGKKREFTGNQDIVSIIRELTKPFGIEVVSEIKPIPRIKTFKIDPGESLFESIERATRKLGIILQPSGDGRLVLTRISQKKKGILLQEGYDFLDCSATYDHQERYSDYILKFYDGRYQALTKTVKDHKVKRYRPLEIVSETPLTLSEAQTKLDWEARVRAARSFDFTATVQGWSHDGKPWLPNTVFSITAPKVGLVDEPLLLRSVDYFFDEDGTTTGLSFGEMEKKSII